MTEFVTERGLSEKNAECLERVLGSDEELPGMMIHDTFMNAGFQRVR